MDETQTNGSPLPLGTVRLSDEDRARMEKLYEEVSGRLREMALITARNLRLSTTKKMDVLFFPPNTAHKSGSKPVEAAKPIVFEGTEIICSSSGCGCYDFDAGVCYVC
ncbi:hypothetical protein QZM22_02015 [Burkholderia oklahomensis]|uniref:hypothetical protein n=1 Tax=Burkholderia oklahomensis TaxID=342113 RepID=UPI00264D6437|nr:hypothetical protein [Burkholderia oklahomensis]MDN7671326.1 hypothetical protein [Burkholderia oklahomensis]